MLHDQKDIADHGTIFRRKSSQHKTEKPKMLYSETIPEKWIDSPNEWIVVNLNDNGILLFGTLPTFMAVLIFPLDSGDLDG